MMQELIDKYFVEHLDLSEEDAKMLHRKYYTDYGLAIEGLVRHHKVDALEYNRLVDDALPLDGAITPDPQLRALLEDIDLSKVRLWLFTNAHITHGMRIVRLLGIEAFFEGITYCDYTKIPLICKPYKEMFEKAELEAGVKSPEQCFFVDDNYSNCKHAQDRGWTAAHLVEAQDPSPTQPASKYLVHNLEELREIWPQFFKHGTARISHPQL